MCIDMYKYILKQHTYTLACTCTHTHMDTVFESGSKELARLLKSPRNMRCW